MIKFDYLFVIFISQKKTSVMKFTFLSREQEKKKVFLQLGGHYHLPIEIIYFLYQTNKKREKEELQNHIDDYKSTYTVNITMNRCLGRLIPTLNDTGEPVSEEDVLNFISGGTGEVDPAGDLIEAQIKQCKKLCETNIKEIGWVDLRNYDAERHELPIQGNRDALLRQIEIIGHPSFLLKERVHEGGPYPGEYYYESLTYQEKLPFMKQQGIELLNLYEEYLAGIDGDGNALEFNIIVLDDNSWRAIWTDDINH